nr:capsid protein [Botryosphaeria dothidea partitivirus 4]
MTKEVAFQPGKFQPVVEIAQRDSGVPAPADSDFTGLEEVALATLHVSNASARGLGSVVSDPVPVATTAQIIAYVLAARNIVEQLLFIGVHTRLTTPLRAASLSPLEPIVRAYNHFGHFELDGKTYVTRDLVAHLVHALFRLRLYATESNADGTKYTFQNTGVNLDKIDFDFYHVNNEGEIAYGKRKPLKDYILDLISYIPTIPNLSSHEKLPWIRFLLDVTTEAGLTQFLRAAKVIEGFAPPDRNVLSEPSADHKQHMKKLFGQEFSTDGDTIPVSKFTGPITNAYNLLRRVSLERSYAMKTIPIPKYEGGSASQLASYIDDVLVSQVPLSLTDSTAAVAFTTSYGVTRAYKSAPGQERAELVRELVSQSLIKK